MKRSTVFAWEDRTFEHVDFAIERLVLHLWEPQHVSAIGKVAADPAVVPIYVVDLFEGHKSFCVDAGFCKGFKARFHEGNVEQVKLRYQFLFDVRYGAENDLFLSDRLHDLSDLGHIEPVRLVIRWCESAGTWKQPDHIFA